MYSCYTKEFFLWSVLHLFLKSSLVLSLENLNVPKIIFQLYPCSFIPRNNLLSSHIENGLHLCFCFEMVFLLLDLFCKMIKACQILRFCKYIWILFKSSLLYHGKNKLNFMRWSWCPLWTGPTHLVQSL